MTKIVIDTPEEQISVERRQLSNIVSVSNLSLNKNGKGRRILENLLLSKVINATQDWSNAWSNWDKWSRGWPG